MTRKRALEEDVDEPLSARWALVIAVIVIVLVRELIPFGQQILYPFTLLSTWVHEMGHGLTGLLVGGTFEKLEVFANGSGLAYGEAPEGWQSGLRAAGGLLAPPFVGAAILALARGPKRSTITLAMLAVVLAVSVPIWVRSLVGWIALPLLALLIGAIAWRMGPTKKHIFAQLVGILIGVDTFLRFDYLFSAEAFVDGESRTSDIAHVAEGLGGHYLLWGVVVALLSIAALAFGLRLAWASKLVLKWPRFRRNKVTERRTKH